MPEHTPCPTFNRAVYGFVLYLTLKTLFVIYLLWIFIPDSIFEMLNISYIPQKHWAIVVPILVLNLTAVFAFFIYPGINLCLTPTIDSLQTITDNCAKNSRRNNKKSSIALSQQTEELNKKTDLNQSKIINGYNKDKKSYYLNNWSMKDKKCTCKYMKLCYLYKTTNNKHRGLSSTSKNTTNLDDTMSQSGAQMHHQTLLSYSVPPLQDIHISNVCKNLYL